MIYFVTGASGFIGKRLVRRLLSHPDSTVHLLTLDASDKAVTRLRDSATSTAVRVPPTLAAITAFGPAVRASLVLTESGGFPTRAGF